MGDFASELLSGNWDQLLWKVVRGPTISWNRINRI